MFDGNGNWTSDFSAQADRDNGIKILASRFDNIFIADIKESFENCLTKDGQITPIGNFNMGGQKITNLNAGVNDNDAVNKSQLDSSLSNLLSSVYPVGSIYIGTQENCPLSSLISGSTWELVAADKALWTGDGTNANTTIAAGLPNITGQIGIAENEGNKQYNDLSGAFYDDNTRGNWLLGSDATGGAGSYIVKFDASKSSTVYGNSTTVQPPAYVVNVWRRTA